MLRKNNTRFSQIKVSDKSNKITAIPKLLKLIDIDGATVPTDAMGTQYKIGEQIVKEKGVQGEFHKDIKLFLDTHLQDEFTKIEHDIFGSY
ncbi:MAG: transposase [Alteromonadales bacterium]|nr:transposase [Alteromonadales bacterium]